MFFFVQSKIFKNQYGWQSTYQDSTQKQPKRTSCSNIVWECYIGNVTKNTLAKIDKKSSVEKEKNIVNNVKKRQKLVNHTLA